MKKVFTLSCLFFICLFHAHKSFSQTVLAPGSMSFIGFNTSGTDGVSFVTFVNLCPGTVFYFTDNPYRNSGGFCTSGEEFCVRFSVTTLIPAGTKITYTDATYPTAGTVSLLPAAGAATASYSFTAIAGTNNGFNSGGDNGFIFQGSYTSPAFVCGFKNSGAYNAAGTVSCGDRNDTELPSTLTLGQNAMVGCVNDGMRYNCTTVNGTAATLGASINNLSNWTCSGSAVALPPSCSFSVTGVPNPLPVVTATVNPATVCSGSTVTLTANGATSYTWSANAGSATTQSTVVSPVATSTFIVTGSVLGCTNTGTVSVSVSALPTLTVSAASSTVCNGQNTVLTATGANTYTWNPGGITGATIAPTPTSTTIYSVTGTNAAGCVSAGSQTVSISVNPTPTVSVGSNSIALCSGSPLILPTAGGGSTFSWSGPNSYTSSVATPTVTGSIGSAEAGVYSVSVSTTSGGLTCTSAAQQVTVSIVSAAAVSVSNASLCTGSSAIITPSGAATYTLLPLGTSGPNFTISPLATTAYTVLGTAGTGCNGSTTFTATVNSLPTLTATASSTLICSGNSSTLSVSGSAGTYTWSPNASSAIGSTITVSPGTGTTYSVTGTSTLTGCTNTAVVAVGVNPTPTVNIAVTSTAVCAGSAASLTLTGASSYTVTNPATVTTSTLLVSPMSSTTYTVVGASSGCSSGTSTVTIQVNPLPLITVSNQTTCAGSPVIINASGANTYNWLPGGATTTSISVAPTTTTTYSVTGTNTLTGCTSTLTPVIVVVNALPTASASVNSAIACATGTVTLSGFGSSSASSYTWTLGNGVIPSNQHQQILTFPASALGNGTYVYTLTVTGPGNCISAPSTVTLTVTGTPNAGFDLSDLSICQGTQGAISINNPQAGVNYSWTAGGLSIGNGNPLQLPASLTTSAGTIALQATSSLGTCTNSTNGTLTVTALPVIALTSQAVSACQNASASLSILSPDPAYTYQWLYNGQAVPGGTSLVINPLTDANAGSYTAIATDLNGCIASLTGVIELITCGTFVPELFTPNGDGKNDGFVIKNIENYPNSNLKIFNRWGNMVYEKNRYLNEFEGFANTGNAMGSEKLPSGTYYVILDYGDEKTETYNGYLLLEY